MTVGEKPCKTVYISLPAELLALVEQAGNGNKSLGIRRCVQFAASKAPLHWWSQEENEDEA